MDEIDILLGVLVTARNIHTRSYITFGKFNGKRGNTRIDIY